MKLIARRYSVPVSGVIYLFVMLMIGMAAMNNQNNLLFWTFAVMGAGLVISWVGSSLTVRGLRVRRLDPRHGAVGEPLVVRYALTNRRRLLPVFNIHVEELPAGGESSWRKVMRLGRAWIMHIGPRDSVHGEAVFWPAKRGRITFDRMRIWTSFPFGLVRRSIVISQPQHTFIYPMLFELRRGVLGSISPRALLGTKVSQHAGAGDDFYGMRDHRPGDSMRHIAWKRTARLDELVVIERTSPGPARLRVILDLTTPTDQIRVEPAQAETARDLEEKAISLAGSILHAADLSGFEYGLTVLGHEVPAIPLRRNPWHRRKVMASLAWIELDAPRIQTQTPPRGENERAGIVVIAPDRRQPLPGHADAWYLTARQLERLAARPVDWDAVHLKPASRAKEAEMGAAA